MSEDVPPGVREVWDWKRGTERKTQGLSREELIAFYREAGDQAEQKLGLSLRRFEASATGSQRAGAGFPAREAKT